MNVCNNTNMIEDYYDKLEIFWGFRKQCAGCDNSDKTSSDMHFVG